MTSIKKVHVVFFALFTCSLLFAEEGVLSEKKITFSNDSRIEQVLMNTLVPTPTATPTVLDTTSKIMKLHGQLLLKNGTVVNDSFSEVKDFYDTRMVGMISAFGSSTLPPGWLLCDGATYDTTTDLELQNLGDKLRNIWGGNGTYNSGTGHFEGEFKVPDLRGMFVRAADSMSVNGSGQPSGLSPKGIDTFQRYSDADFGTTTSFKGVGTYQKDAFVAHGATQPLVIDASTTSSGTLLNHTHTATIPSSYSGTARVDTSPPEEQYYNHGTENPSSQSTDTDGAHSHTFEYRGGLSTPTNSDISSHPKNYAVVYGIRF